MGKLLFDSEPLLIPKELAVKIGLNESIVLQQLHYWVEINRKARINNYDGYIWTYNTIEKWREQFPFWSERTLKRVFKSLKEQNLIITGNYNKKNYDRTLWYTINYNQIELLEKEPLIPCKNSLGQNDTMDSDKLALSPGQNVTMDKDKMTQPIPKTTTETTTKTTTEKSSLPPSDRKDKFFLSMKNEMSEVSFKTFIQPLQIEETENKIIVIAPSDFVKGMLIANLLDKVERSVKASYGITNIEVISKGKVKDT